jgi:hypothetical protein
MHLSISTDLGSFKGKADSILSYDGKKIMVLFFNAYLCEKDIILEKLKEIAELAKDHIFHFRNPVPILISEYRLEYIVIGDDHIVKAFQKALSEKMSAKFIPDRYELPFDIWHLVPLGDHFIKIPGAL